MKNALKGVFFTGSPQGEPRRRGYPSDKLSHLQEFRNTLERAVNYVDEIASLCLIMYDNI